MVRMKILYLAPEGGPGRLTAMSFIDEELLALKERGVEAHILAQDIQQNETVLGIRKWAVKADSESGSLPMAAADVFVMTSLHEGSGNVYLEAQASGNAGDL